MSLLSCPECNKKISEQAAQCPKCGLVLTSSLIENQKNKEAKIQTASICIVAGFFAFIFLAACMGRSSGNSNSASYSSSKTDHDRQIEKYTERQVDRHWRPMPGGNNKEEAVRATSRIRKARTWEELDAAIQQNIKEGI